MPNINTLMGGKYLKKEDVPEPALVTVSRVTVENVAREDEPPERKAVMHFHEYDRGLVMNSTNLQLAAKALNSDDTDDWAGGKLVIYTDDNVSFGGRVVGGLRLRAPKQRQQPAQQTRKIVAEDDGTVAGMDEDIPF